MISLNLALSLLTILLVSTFVNSFRINRAVTRNINPFSARLVLKAKSATEDAPWVTDEDSAELNCESSASLTRAKEAAEEARRKAEELEKARIEAERLAAEAAAAALASAAVNIQQDTPEMSKQVAVVTEPTKKTDVAKTEKTGFDIGLAILFPIMIGTLALFLFFPLYGAQLASKLPPPS